MTLIDILKKVQIGQTFRRKAWQYSASIGLDPFGRLSNTTFTFNACLFREDILADDWEFDPESKV